MMSSTGSNPAPLPAAAPAAVFNMREMRESLALAEQLAKASMSSNKSRSQQLQQLDANNNNEGEETPRTYVPPKQLLLYLVRYYTRTTSARLSFLDCAILEANKVSQQTSYYYGTLAVSGLLLRG